MALPDPADPPAVAFHADRFYGQLSMEKLDAYGYREPHDRLLKRMHKLGWFLGVMLGRYVEQMERSRDEPHN